MPNLFIIGNGFDIAHGFKTKYSDFKAWIESKLPNDDFYDALPQDFFISESNAQEDYITGLKFLKYLFDNNLDLDDKWYSFEDSLSSLPIYDKYEDLISWVLEPNEAFDNPARYDDVCNNIAQCICENVEKIPDYFKDWINSVDVFNPGYKLLISDYFSDDSLYINFNYTETLEDVYGVPETQICHIHGSRSNWRDDLIVGHSDNYILPDRDYDCPGVQSILDEAIERLRKDAGALIDKYMTFLLESMKISLMFMLMVLLLALKIFRISDILISY